MIRIKMERINKQLFIYGYRIDMNELFSLLVDNFEDYLKGKSNENKLLI